MGRDSEAARAIRQAFANYDLPAQQIRRQVLLYLDNTLFYHDRDPYRLLGLTPDCSLSDIRLRHKQMLQVFHPDRHPDEEAWFTDRSEQLNRAYAYLKANHGKPGSASMPYASTVAGSPPPGPARAAPGQRRPPPPPVFPTKEELRRRLNHWLGNPASLQKRVYIALFAIPVLALLLLYLSSESRVKPSTSTVVADAASEAEEAATEQTPSAQQDAPYHPAMGPDPQASSNAGQQEPPETVMASEASDRAPDTDVAMVEIDHPDEIRVSTPIDRSNTAAPNTHDAVTSAAPQPDISGDDREANEAKSDQVTVTSGARAETVHPADTDASAETTAIVSAPQIPDPEDAKRAATNPPRTASTETDTDAARATHEDSETDDEGTPSQQEPIEWTSQPLESPVEPLDPLPERPNPITAAPTTVPEKPKPATEPEHSATSEQDQADSTAASDPTEHDQQADPEAKPEADEEARSRTELASTAQTPDPAPRATDPQRRSPVAAIHALLKTYESAYNRSDINTFANLFRDNAQTKNAANRSEIREKYSKLFRKTSERNLVLDDIRVRTLGERKYEVKTRYKVDWKYPSGKRTSGTGRLKIHIVTVDGELKIWRLDY